MSSLRWGCFVFAVALTVLAGCGSGPRLAEVEGTVKIKGTPREKIQVEFWPESSGPRSMGTTDGQGRFTLTTDDGKRKGAVIGSHRVILKDVGVLGDKFLGRAGEDVDMTEGKTPAVGGDYEDPQKTPVRKTVAAGRNQIDIDVEP